MKFWIFVLTVAVVVAVGFSLNEWTSGMFLFVNVNNKPVLLAHAWHVLLALWPVLLAGAVCGLVVAVFVVLSMYQRAQAAGAADAAEQLKNEIEKLDERLKYARADMVEQTKRVRADALADGENHARNIIARARRKGNKLAAERQRKRKARDSVQPSVTA